MDSYNMRQREISLGWSIIDLSEIQSAPAFSSFRTTNLSKQLRIKEVMKGTPRSLFAQLVFDEGSLIFTLISLTFCYYYYYCICICICIYVYLYK